MQKNNSTSLRVVDTIGGLLVASCVAAFIWIAAVHNTRTGARIHELREMIQAARRDIGAVEAAQARQHSIVQQRQEALSRTGQLPIHAPIDEYFRLLSTMAAAHDLRIISQEPLSPTRYPGLLEQRYIYEVTGSMPNLTRFLKAIEDTDFWADVSYLSMRRGVGAEEAVVNKRVALLTVSLFSAPPANPKPQDKGA